VNVYVLAVERSNSSIGERKSYIRVHQPKLWTILGLRSVEQKACDRLLLLWLIREASPLDRYELQKLPFRVEHELDDESKRGFNYEFFQYDDGPISKEAYDDRDALKELGLISERGITIRITPEGEKFLSEFDTMLKKNEAIVNKITEVVNRLSKMSSSDLVKDTHEMCVVWNSKRIKLSGIPMHSTILAEPDETSIEMDASVLETLIVLLNPKLINDMRKVRREGSTSSPYKPFVAI